MIYFRTSTRETDFEDLELIIRLETSNQSLAGEWGVSSNNKLKQSILQSRRLLYSLLKQSL